jgi:hypothetical protein
LRHGALFSGNSTSHGRSLTFVREPEPLTLGVCKGYRGAPVILGDALVPDAVLLEVPGPPVERLAAVYPELRRRDLPGARVVRGDPELRPVEERDLYTVL